MGQSGWKRLVVAAGVVCLCAAGGVVLWAQTSPRPAVDASMTQLVAEIRTLREAVERSTLVTAQSQLLLGRLQLQEGRLATLGRQVNDARQQLAEVARRERDTLSEIERLTVTANSAVAQEARDQAASLASALKRELKEVQSLVAQRRADEQAASSALAEEQQRWVEFNGRLEALERTIAAAAASIRVRE